MRVQSHQRHHEEVSHYNRHLYKSRKVDQPHIRLPPTFALGGKIIVRRVMSMIYEKLALPTVCRVEASHIRQLGGVDESRTRFQDPALWL